MDSGIKQQQYGSGEAKMPKVINFTAFTTNVIKTSKRKEQLIVIKTMGCGIKNGIMRQVTYVYGTAEAKILYDTL